MKTEEILEICGGMLYQHLARGTTVSLFKAIYPYPLDDVANMASNLQLVDGHTDASLSEKITSSLMDMSEKPLSMGEDLMLRLRLESAMRMLTILSRSKVACEVQTQMREEAACWALTTLWTGCRDLWVYHTASAFREGKPSALPYRMPP